MRRERRKMSIAGVESVLQEKDVEGAWGQRSGMTLCNYHRKRYTRMIRPRKGARRPGLSRGGGLKDDRGGGGGGSGGEGLRLQHTPDLRYALALAFAFALFEV